MALQELVCKTCSGKIIYDPELKKGRCLFCGVEYIEEEVNNTINNNFTGDVHFNGTVIQNITNGYENFNDNCAKLLEAGLLGDLQTVASQYIEKCPADFMGYYYWLASQTCDFSDLSINFSLRNTYEKAIRLSKNCKSKEYVERVIEWEKACAMYAFSETGENIKPEYINRYMEECNKLTVCEIKRRDNLRNTIICAVGIAFLVFCCVINANSEDTSIVGFAALVIVGLGFLTIKFVRKLIDYKKEWEECVQKLNNMPRYNQSNNSK